MTTTPPFNPPYTTTLHEGAGTRIVHTLADGTTSTVTSGPAFDAVKKQHISTNAPSRSTAVNAKAEKKVDLTHGNKRVFLFLEVPYSDKDEAKRTGAKWDSTARKWFVPHGLDVNLFSRWWPDNLKQSPELFE